MRKMMTLLALAFLLFTNANAQNDVDVDVSVNGNGEPVVTWTPTPEAQSCSSSWADSVDPLGGMTTLERLSTTASTTLSVNCSWQGDSMATLSWENPTENTDGSSYDPTTGETILVWSQEDISGLSCYDADTVNTTTRPGDQTMHTVTDLEPGDWNFAAYARDSMGVCSDISNVATKTTTSEVTASASVTLTPPGSVGGLEAS